MHIQLKNIKYAAFASEETACFEGSVYLDGKKAGFVSNDGQGGAMNFHPWQLETRLNDYGKSLPQITASWKGDDGEPFMYDQDAESVINGLLDDYLLERDRKKQQRRRAS
jgi:hypothetical protein